MGWCENRHNAGAQSGQAVTLREGMMSCPKRTSDASLIYRGETFPFGACCSSERCWEPALVLCCSQWAVITVINELFPFWALPLSSLSNWREIEVGARTRAKGQEQSCGSGKSRAGNGWGDPVKAALLIPYFHYKQNKQNSCSSELFGSLCFRADGGLYIPLWKACKLQWHES